MNPFKAIRAAYRWQKNRRNAFDKEMDKWQYLTRFNQEVRTKTACVHVVTKAIESAGMTRKQILDAALAAICAVDTVTEED